MDDMGKEKPYNKFLDEEDYHFYNSLIYKNAYQYIISNYDFESYIGEVTPQ
jgi:hypothetical protein